MWAQALARTAAAAVLAVLAGCAGARRPAPPDPAAVRAVRAVLDVQVAAWNRGDVRGFMDGYARTDSLRFASGGAVRYGWQATLDGYLRGYPDRRTMGRLTFSDLRVTPLAPDAAVVFGRWGLERDTLLPAAAGLFTLVFRRTPAGWKIVHDHTSSGGG